MNDQAVQQFIRRAQASALVGLPVLWLLMFAMHFRSIAEFFVFRGHYIPVPAAEKVMRLIAAKNRWPMIHDPHLLGYLSLPLLVLGAFGLYRVGRRVRPAVATLGIAMTVTGTIFLGGVMGLFTTIVRSLGDVDARFTDGAIATYSAVTAEDGAYGLTRGLAQLALWGIVVQILAMWKSPNIPRWATAAAIFGCMLFLAFWDVDNMMFIGSLGLLAGFFPVSREILRQAYLPSLL
jgi:hypothetical protein